MKPNQIRDRYESIKRRRAEPGPGPRGHGLGEQVLDELHQRLPGTALACLLPTGLYCMGIISPILKTPVS